MPKTLRVISRPMTVPADRIAFLKAGLSRTVSRNPGCGEPAGTGIGGTGNWYGGTGIGGTGMSDAGGYEGGCAGSTAGCSGGASLAANRS